MNDRFEYDTVDENVGDDESPWFESDPDSVEREARVAVDEATAGPWFESDTVDENSGDDESPWFESDVDENSGDDESPWSEFTDDEGPERL